MNLLLLFAAPLLAQEEIAPARGLTVLESRDMATRLADAELLLKEGSLRTAVATLQSVLEADRAHLVRPNPQDLLFVGAATEA